MFDCDEAWRGSWSIRYMSMKPRMRERPTQACGELCSSCSSCATFAGGTSSGFAPGESSPEFRSGLWEDRAVEVTADVEDMVTPAGRTGPGIALNSSVPRLSLFHFHSTRCIGSTFRTLRTSPLACHRTSKGAADISLRLCACVLEPAL